MDMTQENQDINSLDPCPPEDFLRAYATGSLKDKALQSVILSHLEFCPSCQQKVREFKRAVSPDDDPIAKRAQALRERQLAQQRAVAQGPTPGTIWRTVPESEKDPFGPLVLVIDRQEAKDGAALTVAEVSEEIGQAIHTDMVLDPKESGLRFRCMVRTGNIFKVSPDRLTLFAGVLSQALMDKVSGFCKDAERFDENIPLSKFVFLKDSQGTELMRRRGITSGMLVTEEDDPRLEFLQLSKQRCSYLSGKSTATSKSGSKVIPLPLRKPFLKTIMALAAVLATVVVTWKGLEIVSDRPVARPMSPKIAAERSITEADRVPTIADKVPVDPIKGKEVLKAAKSGDLATLRRLVKNASLANFFDRETHTAPLHLAALNSHLAAVRFLIDKGARINGADADGKTALILAATKGHREMVELLLKKGANPMLSDKEGKTALSWALANGHKEIAEILKSRSRSR
jgi:hypothetical protein